MANNRRCSRSITYRMEKSWQRKDRKMHAHKLYLDHINHLDYLGLHPCDLANRLQVLSQDFLRMRRSWVYQRLSISRLSQTRSRIRRAFILLLQTRVQYSKIPDSEYCFWWWWTAVLRLAHIVSHSSISCPWNNCFHSYRMRHSTSCSTRTISIWKETHKYITPCSIR